MSVRRSLHTGLRQAFAVLLPARTMGVMSDGRAYGQACVLRAVTFTDGVTADYHPFASFTAISPPTVTIPTLSYLTELAFFISQSDGWSAPATNPVEVGLSYRPSRCYVARSLSEDYLLSLAERTFLKLWAVPNSFYASGKELTDLIVPFGDDVIIISDKACRFDFKKSLNVAWGRWYRSGIEDSLRQLKTAMRQVRRAPDSIFTDARASIPLPWSVAPGGKPRFHLVAIARPDSSPGVIPPEWPGLRYVANAHGEPFKIGKLEVGGQQVHVFDGPTIDLLLEQIDTAPDFIAYLTGRAARLVEAKDYDFSECDLIGAALIGWEAKSTRPPSVPPLDAVVDGLWEIYDSGDTAAHRRKADRVSRVIDDYIEQTHGEFAAGRMLYGKPSYAQHERAMRLLAAESRFARRVIAHELYDILDEPDRSTFWASTTPSPTMPSLRYVWLIYPKRPDDMSEAVFDHMAMGHLKQHVLVAQGLFQETLVLGICLPNRSANDTATFTVLHDGSNWTEADRQEAMKLHERGIFAGLEAHERVHIP